MDIFRIVKLVTPNSPAAASRRDNSATVPDLDHLGCDVTTVTRVLRTAQNIIDLLH